MSQQTYTPGGTQVAEPPAPLLPTGDSGSGADNRRKLTIVGAVVGVVVLAIVAFFLMKGGSSSTGNNSSFVPAHHHATAPVAAQPPVVKLPKHVAAPVGRDPFKALYVAPADAAPGTTTGATQPTQSAGGTTTTTSGGTTSTTTTPTYHPVWVQLKAVSSTAASFNVGYSNGKTLKALLYSGVKPLHSFASSFELLSIRSGVVTVKFGDGSPFKLDRTHNTMVVD
jgi:hypothetical protein